MEFPKVVACTISHIRHLRFPELVTSRSLSSSLFRSYKLSQNTVFMIIHYHKIYNMCLFDQEKQLPSGKNHQRDSYLEMATYLTFNIPYEVY